MYGHLLDISPFRERMDPEATWPDTDSVYRNKIVIIVIDPDDQFALIPCRNFLNNEDLSTEIILIIH